MKKLILGLLSALVLLLVTAIAIPFFIRIEDYKPQITAAVLDATGRELTIAGDIRLSVFPKLELEARQVTFSNVSEGRVPNMASLEELII